MKALTIKQPWAELIISGHKDVENRSIGCNYRGKLAIHVSKQAAPASDLGDDTYEPWVIEVWRKLPDAGMVIGTVDLIDCVRDSESEWALPGAWHWVIANPRRYRKPIMARGQLGLWEWSR